MEQSLFKADSKAYPLAMQKSYYSRKNRAIIFYDTTGSLSVDTTDLNGNSVPDYVEAVGDIFETVWTFQIDSLAHKEPILLTGWEEPFPVFLNESRVFYGATYFMLPGFTTGEFTQFPSYLQINPNLSKLDNAIDATKVTIAHEMYHAIQFSYGVRYEDEKFTDLWLLEQTATAFEEFIFDEVNDYYQYLNDIQVFPWINGITRISPFSYYGHCILYIMLQEQFGHIDFMKQIWLEQFEYPGEAVLQRIAELNNSDLQEILKDYAIWRYYTGLNWQPGYFSEGLDYPQVAVYLSQDAQAISPQNSVREWGLEYHQSISANKFQVNPSVYPVLVHDLDTQKTAWFAANKTVKLEKNINYLISFWDTDIRLNLDAPNDEHVLIIPNPVFSDNSVKIEKARSGEFIDIYNSIGQLVRSLKADLEGIAVWDKRNKNNNIVASGIYYIHLKNSNRVGKCILLN